MYCGKCGAKNEDGDVFCRECGERILGEAPRTATPPPAREKQGHYRKVGILAVAVVIVAAVVAAIFLFGGPKPYEKPLKLFVDGSNSLNASTALQSILPEKALQKMAEENEDFMEAIQEEAMKGFDGQNVKMSYKLEGASSALASDVSDSIRSELENEYDIEITDQKKLEVKLSVKKDGIEASVPASIIVYEADGKWYLDPMSLQDAFSDFSF